MNELISLSFWFNSRPEVINSFGQKTLSAIAAISVIVYLVIILKAYSEKLAIYRPSINKILPFCLTNVIVSAYMGFVNYELIPVLRARFWYIVWLIIAIIWIIVIIKDFFKRAKKRQDLAKDAERKRYLPK